MSETGKKHVTRTFCTLGARLVQVDICRSKSLPAPGAFGLKIFLNMLKNFLEAQGVPDVCLIRFK